MLPLSPLGRGAVRDTGIQYEDLVKGPVTSSAAHNDEKIGFMRYEKCLFFVFPQSDATKEITKDSVWE